MSLIVDNDALDSFIGRAEGSAFVTVDTEFIRDRTYWPKLCLVQVAGPDDAVAIDALAPGLDLDPLFGLLTKKDVIKVFHAARQDVEIFYHMKGVIPAPLFDTQVAAMVCGFGDAVGYETLAAKLARARIDKSLRFTDWARRPLSERQIQYALSDVTHLRVAYEKLVQQLESSGRAGWISEEMEVLTDPATYRLNPREAWRRLKTRSSNPRYLAILRELAACREDTAQRKDVPRNRIVRDDVLLEIAAHEPATKDELTRQRGMDRSQAAGTVGEALVAAVALGKAMPEAESPTPLRAATAPTRLGPMTELLKVLLKMKCQENDVAQKLIASSADIDEIAADDKADVPALFGWRRQVFGEDALALKHGRIALAATGRNLTIVTLDGVNGDAKPSRRKRAG